MHIAIRADASIQLGAGHIMRCLTLARELSKNATSITFLCKKHPGNLIANIINEHFTVLQLSPPNNDLNDGLLGGSQKDDASDCINALVEVNYFDLMIVDHYDLDHQWQQLMMPYCQRFLVIDDLADRKHLADLLLDQTINRKSNAYKGLVPENCQLLLGQDFMLLRDEFFLHKKAIKTTRLNQRDLNNILVTMGAMDSNNVTLLVLEGLTKLNKVRENLTVVVILTSQAPHLHQIKAYSSAYPWIEIKTDVTNIAEVMSRADIAIGASGSTSWERCCLALPTLTVINADNQILVDESLAALKATISLGWYNTLTSDDVFQQGKELLENRQLYNQMVIASDQVCDGLGVKRVADRILKNVHSIKLSLATLDDCETVFKWQSDKRIRKYFHEPLSPSWNEHCIWFKQALEDESRLLYLISDKELPIGILRLDKLTEAENKYEVSILLCQDKQGQGIGLKVLKKLPLILSDAIIYAHIHKENHASHKVFIKAGFSALSPILYRKEIFSSD